MSTQTPSRASANPFLAPGQPTLADVITRLRADGTIPERRQQDMISAVRSFARALGNTPEGLPAHPQFLRMRLKRLAPAQTGMSLARWRNVTSLVNGAIRAAGYAVMPGRYTAPLSAAWTALWAKLDTKYLQCGLSRLLHYCSAHGIGPEVVDDDVLVRFHAALVAESLFKDPDTIHQHACRCWNKARATVPGWPQQLLTIPRKARAYTLPWSAFAGSFRADAEAYLARRASVLPLDEEYEDDAPELRPAAPGTVELRRFQIRQFASALVHRGVPPAQLTGLAALVEPKLFAEGLRFFLARSGGTTNRNVHDLACFFKAVARHWVRVDAGHLKKLHKICKQLEPEQRGLTAKNTARLRPFDDPTLLARLQHLPQHVFDETARRDRGAVVDALKVQIALAIEILMMAPMRIGNLRALDLERHMVRSGPGGLIRIVIPAQEVKNRKELDYELPPHLVRMLDLYRARYRPRLLEGPSTALFPGRGGRPKHKHTLGQQMSRMIAARTGCAMNPHLFRHLAAKVYLDRHPGQYEFIRQVLGITIETVLKAYTGLERPAAIRHFQSGILKIRAELPSISHRRGTGDAR